MSCLLSFAQKHENTNVLILKAPVRYDPLSNYKTNRDIMCLNDMLHKSTTLLGHVHLIEMPTDEKHFNNYGLHLNKVGKETLVKNIASKIWEVIAPWSTNEPKSFHHRNKTSAIVTSDSTHKTSDTVVNGKSETPVLINKMINIIVIDEMPSVHKASTNPDELNEPEVKTLLNKLTEEEDRVNATETDTDDKSVNKLTEEEDRVNATETVTDDKSDPEAKTELVNIPDIAIALDDMIMETITCPETSSSVNSGELDLSSDISNTSMANLRRPSSRIKTPAPRSSDFLW